MIWPKWSRFFAKDFTPEYWRTGLQKLANRERPPDTEKYGYVLTAENELRGVVLTIPSVHEHDSERHVFINISSWYLQPPFPWIACQRTLSGRELPSKYHLHESLCGRTYGQDDRHLNSRSGRQGRLLP
jgi:hypothetical protein